MKYFGAVLFFYTSFIYAANNGASLDFGGIVLRELKEPSVCSCKVYYPRKNKEQGSLIYYRIGPYTGVMNVNSKKKRLSINQIVYPSLAATDVHDEDNLKLEVKYEDGGGCITNDGKTKCSRGEGNVNLHIEITNIL